jgi:hypothetical protein
VCLMTFGCEKVNGKKMGNDCLLKTCCARLCAPRAIRELDLDQNARSPLLHLID